MLLLWTGNLSIGVKSFDDDHKRLLQIIHDLHLAIEDANATGKVDAEEIEIALHRLENYVRYHCAREEVLMEQTGYPAMKAHKLEHRKFHAMVLEMQALYRDSTNTAHAAELMNFIYNWITNHIHVTDKIYGEYLNSKKIF